LPPRAREAQTEPHLPARCGVDRGRRFLFREFRIRLEPPAAMAPVELS
jgi:hypothetical protein